MVMQINILVLMLLLCSASASAAVTAQVDRYNLSVDETINLMIEVSDDDSGEPDTAPLQQNFHILSRNQSSSYSLINGAMSSKSTWFLVLRPRHAGALTIPALTVGNKQTTAINIQVSKIVVRELSGTAPQGNLWIDMSVEPTTVRVQQQAIITLRIYQAITLSQAQLTEPQSDRAMLIRLGEDKNYQVKREGRNWSVTERRYALFPQQHGSLKLEPVQLNGSVVAGRNYGSPFQSTRPVHVQSNALALSVDSMPSDWSANTWLPAKQIQLLEDWPTGEFKVGDSITRTLTLHANGLNSSQLPELTTLLPDHLKAYTDKPVLTDSKQSDGVHGSRQEKLAILATRPGTFILPAIDVIWWNTASKTMQTASLPPRAFKVLPAPVGVHRPTPLQAPQIKPETETKPEQATASFDPETNRWWKWLALFALAAWLLTLMLLFRQKTFKQRPRADAPTDLSEFKQAIRYACQHNQAKACEKALLDFAQAQWLNDDVNNLAAMGKHCDAPLAQAMHMLELHLYANSTHTAWRGELLLQAFEQAVFSKSDQQANSEKHALPALYSDQQ